MRNDRLIAAAGDQGTGCVWKTTRDLKGEMLAQIEHFFISYNAIEGKKFTPLRRSGPTAALKLVGKTREAYERQSNCAPQSRIVFT